MRIVTSPTFSGMEQMTGYDSSLPLKPGDHSQVITVARDQIQRGETVKVRGPTGHDLSISLQTLTYSGTYWTFEGEGDLKPNGERGSLFVVVQIR